MSDVAPVDARLLLAVAAGGAAGALLRWSVDLAAPATTGGFPFTTLAINMVGAFALGLLHALGRGYLDVPVWVRVLIGPGLLGGFTTFSVYALQTRDLLASGATGTALAYLLATPVGALVAVEAALRLLPRGRR